MSIRFVAGFRGFAMACCLAPCLAMAAQTMTQTAPGFSTVAARPAAVQGRSPAQLNVSLAVLDPGIPADPVRHRQLGVFPKIRKVEARFLPFVLRETLTNSGDWGAVRVVPGGASAAELLISGTIIQSDGATLVLQLRAMDATGRVWIDSTYSARTTEIADNTSEGAHPQEPFQVLFDTFANDLRAARAALDEASLRLIGEVALLRYAANLLPEVFGDYVHNSADLEFTIRRLPARDDPMLKRIVRIREVEYLFTDTLDEQYESLYTDIAPTYNLWRQYQNQLVRYKQAEEQRRISEESRNKRGSYAAIRKSYENYKWVKLEEQNLENWAAGFNNEVDPTVIDLEGRVVRLGGSLEQRYAEWRTILESIFGLESGTTDVQTPTAILE